MKHQCFSALFWKSISKKMSSGGSQQAKIDKQPMHTAEVAKPTSVPSSSPGSAQSLPSNKTGKQPSSHPQIATERQPNVLSTTAGSGNASSETNAAQTSSDINVNMSTSTAIVQGAKSRRKSAPRAKKDGEENKNKPVAVCGPASSLPQTVIPQGPLMLASPPAGQFMLVQHNGQCFMMPAAQYFGSNQQLASVRPAQSQQPLLRPNIVTGSTNLGQLVRSLVPKPTSSNLSNTSSSSSQNSNPPSLTFQTVPTSALGHGNNPCGTLPAPQSQMSTGISQLGQQSVFQQGIHIRAAAPGTSSGIVLQMPNGGYTYVQQVVASTQQQGVISHQQQGMPTFINQQGGAQQTVHLQPTVSMAPPNMHPNQPLTSTNKCPSAGSVAPKKAMDNEQAGGNKASDVVKSPSNLTGSPSTNSASLAASDSSPSKGTSRMVGGKQTAGAKGKPSSAPPKAHIPPTIAPSNLVPVGAPMPMMVMSAAAVPQVQMGTFAGPAVPVMGPGGQIIHQQLIPASPIPNRQMIPVFQQQQNIPGFAIPQHQPTLLPNGDSTVQNSAGRKRVVEDGSSADSGAENEPPPLLVQGDASKDALDVHMLFMKEADRYYRKAGRSGKVVHLIEGFEIEESDEPFPCEQPVRMDDWVPVELLDRIQISKSPEEKSPKSETCPKKSAKSGSDNDREKSEGPSVTPKSMKDSPKKGRGKTSTSSKGKEEERGSRTTAEKKTVTKKRKANEVQRLLEMDFGPNQGRLCDMLGTSLEEKAAERERKQNEQEKKEPAKDVKEEEGTKIEETDCKESSAQCEENTSFIADLSLNSSKGSSGDGGIASMSFSDEELDTERCNYCNGLLRLKRYDNHPQYCSKKCRKLWKKNPQVSEEFNNRSLNTSPRQASGTTAGSSSPIKDISNPSLHRGSSHFIPSTSHTPSVGDVQQQHTAPVLAPLTLKVVSPQQAEIVKSPKVSISSQHTSGGSGESSAPSSSRVMVVQPVQEEHLDFLERPARLWSCDEVAKWIVRVTGSEECGGTFRNQDIDGQSLLLLAENSHHNLGTLLGLKLGPVVKIQNALRELAAKSVNL